MEGIYQEIPAQRNHVIYQLFSGVPTEEYSYTVKIHIADIIFHRHGNTKGNCRKVRDIPKKEIPTEETPTKVDVCCFLLHRNWEIAVNLCRELLSASNFVYVFSSYFP